MVALRGRLKPRVSAIAAANALLELDHHEARCPICGDVFYRGPVPYDFFSPVVAMNEREARKLVLRARMHCKSQHKDQQIWNTMASPSQSVLPTTFEEQVDYLLHLALANGVRYCPLRRDQSMALITRRDLAHLYLLRLGVGQQWFKWILPRRGKLRNQLVKESGRCASEEALNRLHRLIQEVLDFLKVPDNMKVHDDDIATEQRFATFNRLQLLALDPGRYKSDRMLFGRKEAR